MPQRLARPLPQQLTPPVHAPQKVIYGQQHKEARKFHSETSAEEVLRSWAAQFASQADSGHLTLPGGPPAITPHALDGEAQLGSLSSELISVQASPMPVLDEQSSEGISNSRSHSGRTASGCISPDEEVQPLQEVRAVVQCQVCLRAVSGAIV